MSKVKKIILISIIIRLGLVLGAGYHPDIRNHLDWGEKLWKYGPRDFYESIFWDISWPNQPPGSMYLFGLISKVNQLTFTGLTFLNQNIGIFPSFLMPFFENKLSFILVKLPFIFAEVGLGWVVYRIILDLTNETKKAVSGACLILFNPALIFNSAVWGQTDALINLLGLIGIWTAWRKKYLWAFFAFLASLYFKLSLIIWLPVFGLIMIRNKDWIKKLLAFVLASIFYLIISLPFVHHGNVFTWLWYMYTNRVLPRQGNMLSGNAFNFWTVVFGVDLGLKETISFLGTTARKIGRYLTGAIAIFLSGFNLLNQIKFKPKFKFYLLNLVLLTMAAFLFLTNMHERYLYPIFAPSAILTALGVIPSGLFWILTAVHLLNLYNLWWYPAIPFLRAILERNQFLLPRAMSFVLIILFGLFIVKFIKLYNKK